MLKSIIACLGVLTACAYAGSIPVPLYGEGSWADDAYDWDEYGYISASGTNGVDTVSFWIQNENSSLYQGFLNFSTLSPDGGSSWGATIDGSIGSFMSVSLLDGNGVLTLYGAQKNEIASVPIVGYISVTSAFMWPDYNCCHIDSEGYFKVSPIPEPHTMFLGLPLILLFLLLMYRNRTS